MVYFTVSFRPISRCHPLSDLHRFSIGDSQISGTWTHFRLQAPHYQFGAPGGKLALHHWTTVLQGPQVMIAMDNTAVVSVFPQQDGIHPHAPSCLVVVFYSMASISPVMVNQPLTTEWSLHPEIVPGLFVSWDTPTVDMLARGNHSPQYPSSQFRFPISNPSVLAIGFSVLRQGRQVYVFTPFCPIFNKSAETSCHNSDMSERERSLSSQQLLEDPLQ